MKGKKVLLSVTAAVLLMGSSIAAVASTNVYEEFTCGVCQAPLVSYGTPLGHYDDSHPLYYVVDGNKVEEICNVGHSIDQVDKYCPTHGHRWRANRHTERHSNPNCPHYNKDNVYYE